MKPSILRRAGWSMPAALLLSLVLAGQSVAATWSPKIRLTSSGFGEAHGLITLGSSTAVALYETTESRIFIRRTTNSGSTWRARQELDIANFATGVWPAIAGRGTSVDVVGSNATDSFGGTELLYLRSTDSGVSFGAPVQLTHVSPGHIAARVARGPNGLVAVVWHEGSTNRIRARVSTNGGSSFGSARTLATISADYVRLPVVAVGNGVVYAAYFIDNRQIRMRRSLDGGVTWKTATTVANNGSLRETIDALALTAEGSAAYVGYAFKNSSGIGIRYRRTTDKGATWSAAANLAAPSNKPRYGPKLSLRDGVVRASFARCTTSKCAGSAVFYRQSTNGTSWSAADKASHNAADWANPAGVGYAGRVILLYTGDNGGTSPYGPNSDVYARAGTP
jgi:hypothetical protein